MVVCKVVQGQAEMKTLTLANGDRIPPATALHSKVSRRISIPDNQGAEYFTNKHTFENWYKSSSADEFSAIGRPCSLLRSNKTKFNYLVPVFRRNHLNTLETL